MILYSSKMFKSFKVNTAIIICAAFILKLLVINAGFFSLNGKINTPAKAQLINTTKIKTIEAATTSSNDEYLAEICEEDSDEETQLKINSFFPTQVLYYFFGVYNCSDSQNTLPLPRNFSFIETSTCVTLQVFRI